MELNLASYINAGYSVLWIDTHEESRVEASILKTAQMLKKRIKVWSCTEGIVDVATEKTELIFEPTKMLEHIKKDNSDIFILKDFHAFLGNPLVKRTLRDLSRDFKQVSKTIIIVSGVRDLPRELEHDITVLEYVLPTKEEIEVQFNTMYNMSKKEIGKIDDETKDKIVQAALGLTSNEAENAFAKAIVDCNKNVVKIPKLVLMEKANTVKKSGILEYFEANSTMSDVGGLDVLKNWLTLRSKAYSKKAREYNLPLPRGILICGLPGTGKSLCAKAASNLWDIPLIRFDISKVFAGLVGESEANWRNSISIVDAIGNCILWFDELEKGISGMANSGKTDGGTSTRIFGNFLTWMQEKKSPVFIIATVNQIANLPPELIRKGRFDEIFYVGLPSLEERKVILDIHIRKYGRDPKNLNKAILNECAIYSEEFSGAELEESIITALYAAFENGEKIDSDISELILNAIKNTNPLSKSRGPELLEMKAWAENNAVSASGADYSKKTNGRKLKI